MEEVETALVKVEPESLALAEKRFEWDKIKAEAAMVMEAGLAPDHITDKRTPEEAEKAALVIMLTGREWDVPPMMSLQHIVLIHNKPFAEGILKLAKIYQSGKGRIDVIESTPQTTTIRGTRTDLDPPAVFETTWTMGRVPVRYRSGENYRNWPAHMLRWRAIGEISDILFPDITCGMKSPEDVGMRLVEGRLVGQPELVGQQKAEAGTVDLDSLKPGVHEDDKPPEPVSHTPAPHVPLDGGRGPDGKILGLEPPEPAPEAAEEPDGPPEPTRAEIADALLAELRERGLDGRLVNAPVRNLVAQGDIAGLEGEGGLLELLDAPDDSLLRLDLIGVKVLAELRRGLDVPEATGKLAGEIELPPDVVADEVPPEEPDDEAPPPVQYGVDELPSDQQVLSASKDGKMTQWVSRVVVTDPDGETQIVWRHQLTNSCFCKCPGWAEGRSCPHTEAYLQSDVSKKHEA